MKGREKKRKLINQEDRPIPEPKEGEAQIAMSVTGLCGSDRKSHLLVHSRKR